MVPRKPSRPCHEFPSTSDHHGFSDLVTQAVQVTFGRNRPGNKIEGV